MVLMLAKVNKKYFIKELKMWRVESELKDKIEDQIKKILLEMGYNNGSGHVTVNYEDLDLSYTEEYLEVWATTYRGQERIDDHTHRVKVPWKYIFNYQFKKDMELDKIREKEIAELKRLQAKYPDIK